MRRLSILVLYNDTALGTAYVMEHVFSIARHSRNLVHYLPATRRVARADIVDRYDAVIIHFSVRLPFESLLDPELASAVTHFRGAKIAMPQDEYDLPLITTRRLIELGIDSVFTTVPELGPDRLEASTMRDNGFLFSKAAALWARTQMFGVK